MRPLRSPFQLREREKTGDISGYLGLSTTAALRRAERDTGEFAYRITFKANKKNISNIQLCCQRQDLPVPLSTTPIKYRSVSFASPASVTWRVYGNSCKRKEISKSVTLLTNAFFTFEYNRLTICFHLPSTPGKWLWSNVPNGKGSWQEKGADTRWRWGWCCVLMTGTQTNLTISSLGWFSVQGCNQITYLKRQTVCAKPSGTGLVPSAASWCSPCGSHSVNYPRAHPKKKLAKVNIIQL